jgi:hypothetical protein
MSITSTSGRMILSVSALALAVALTQRADAAATDDVVNAAKALAAKSSYAWRTTVEVPADARFRPGPTEGAIEKDGYMIVTSSLGPTTAQTIKKGDEILLSTQDGGWETVAEADRGEGFGRFRALMARNIQTPAELAADLAQDMKELKKEGNVYSGELSEEGARAVVSSRPRRASAGAQPGPTVRSAKGSVKFWIEDGVLTKFEHKVDGTMEFNNNEIQVVRTTTTEIRDVGSAKVEIPAGAKAKLQ